MNKQNQYVTLIEDFKQQKNLGPGLLNPFDLITTDNSKVKDYNHINPVSIWQHNLNAQIVIVGQDWGPTNEFLRNGRDRNDNLFVKRLIELFNSIDIQIGTPSDPIPADLFFTNIVLGLRDGNNYSGPFDPNWIEPSEKYLERLINIISPKMIICLGEQSTRTIFQKFNLKFISMKDCIGNGPKKVGDFFVLGLYHPSTRSINRTLEAQKADWKTILNYIS